MDRWLAPFASSLRHKTRARMLATYVDGLIAPGDRKSIHMIAARAPKVTYDQLHHFLTSDAWSEAPLEAGLLAQAAQTFGRDGKHWLVVRDAALIKKGAHSVGVAPQYALSAGRQVNCQKLVSVAMAAGGTPLPLAMRLYLPPSWVNDPARLQQAGVPENFHSYRDKASIALAEVERILAAGVAPAGVLIDGGFSLSSRLRKGLSEKGMRWTIAIPDIPTDQANEKTPLLVGSGAAPLSPALRVTPANAAWLLSKASWQTVSWRGVENTRQSARFAASRLSIADSPEHAPEDVWLLGEQHPDGEQRYFMSNLSAKSTVRQLASTLKTRQIGADGHEKLRQDLGLEQFEGRSWTGLHRHCLMIMLAAAYLHSCSAA